ncbi:AraC family transcriptional regulator [uncultured Hoeflea sp.]|uniref:helix-turn-helix domain-containing protein n=1 Tax=uncultured Hoeflea sp. TaxID=538666 RepID=UPI00261AAA57|nr:AraC family transcriptional regulator [uncultured Hoeflea sp.]
MTFELSVVDLIDLVLRGGTFGIILLVIARLLRQKEFGPLCASGVLFGITGLVEIVLNAPTVVALLPPQSFVTHALQQLHFIALWWFVLALFNDRFRWRVWHLWPVAIAAPLVAGASWAPAEMLWYFRLALVLMNATLLGLIIRQAVRSRDGDLVDERRSFSLALAFSVPPFTLFVLVTNLMSIDAPLEAGLCLLYSSVYFVLALGFSFWLTNLKDGLFERSGNDVAASPERSELSSADRLELDRVVTAMDGGLYLEPGLTIGGLSDILSVPEHRLRRLINGGLGYRNFSAFVNDYRIREAKRRLADPGLAREQIIQHAFSLGYASLAPFNRAFRERVGVSPTQFREEALGRVAAE